MTYLMKLKPFCKVFDKMVAVVVSLYFQLRGPFFSGIIRVVEGLIFAVN
jgi:hypothetical protein